MRPLSQLASDEVSNATDLGFGGTSSSRRTIAIEGTSRVRCHGPDNLIKRLESFSRDRRRFLAHSVLQRCSRDLNGNRHPGCRTFDSANISHE